MNNDDCNLSIIITMKVVRFFAHLPVPHKAGAQSALQKLTLTLSFSLVLWIGGGGGGGNRPSCKDLKNLSSRTHECQTDSFVTDTFTTKHCSLKMLTPTACKCIHILIYMYACTDVGLNLT